MIFVLKTSITISLLSCAVLYLLRMLVKKPFRAATMTASHVTVLTFLCLCIGQVFIAFAAIGTVVAYFTRRRAVGAGVALFVVLTMPAVLKTVMAGSLQLINITSETGVILGLLVGSFMWTGRPGRHDMSRDLPAYMIIAVLTFISVRDTTITNILRVLVENLIAFILPYLLIRNGLRDATAIRNAFLFVTAAGLCLSAVAIFESVRVWPIYQAYAQQFGTMSLANVKMRGGMLRAGGPLMNPPLSGAILALCFVATFAARDLFRTAMGHRIVLAVLVAGLFAMQTRAAWLGAVFGTVGVVVSRRGIRGVIGYAPVLLIAAGGAYAAALVSPRIAGLIGFSADAQGSSQYRDQLGDLGWAIVRQHPAIGQSATVVQVQMASLRQGEGIVDFVNGYLGIALLSGLIGLGLFVGALLLQGYRAYAGKRVARARGGGSFADLGLGVVAAAGSMFPFVPPDYRIVTTMMLLFALSNAVELRSHVTGGERKPVPLSRRDPDDAAVVAAA
jgi:O-antigen ligase